MKRITKIEENKPVGGKTRVAAYCRVSSDQDSQLLSLETQKAHYEAWIKSNPSWEFAGLYYDEGISGTKKDTRPALMRMITDCEHGLIDYVVTKSISRFARNTTDTLELVRKLLDLNIPIFFEKENINTGNMESELLLSIMSSLAESESVSISENAKWGIRHRFQNGTFKCGFMPYGYDWDRESSEMVVNQEQAVIVREIFRRTLAGVGADEIARDLQKRAIPTKKGGKWTGQTITAIIRNEKYTGDCLFQKTYTDSSFNRHTNRGEQDQFYASDHHEAIISHADYEAANGVVDRRRAEKGIESESMKYQKRYPLSGKVICGECGGKLKRKTYPTQVLLACTTHLKDKSRCTMKSVEQTAVEEAFNRMMNKLIYGRTKVLFPFYKALSSASQTDALLRIHEFDEALERLTEKRQVLKNLLAQGILEPAVYTEQLNRLTAETEKVQQKRAALTETAADELGHMEEARKLLRFTEHAEPLQEFDGDLFSEFVEQVIVESRTVLTFRMRCGLNLREAI